MSMNRPYYLDPIFVSAPSRNEAASATHSYQPRTLSPDSGCQPRPPDKPCCTREGAELSLCTFCFKFWREYCEHRDETTCKSLYTFVSCEPPILLKHYPRPLPRTAYPREAIKSRFTLNILWNSS